MRALLAILFLLLPTQAIADVYMRCQYYQSTCSAKACLASAEKLKTDTTREILKLRTMERLDYTIGDNEAMALFETAAPGATYFQGKHVLRYAFVTQSDSHFTLENKTDAGVVKESVSIDKTSGFYTKYLFSTDNSLKDVPVGEPYTAYFGWCDAVFPAASQPQQ